MRSDAPPRVATVLLRCLMPGEEALAGDLQEEYRSGRSRSWYWRQVGAAIAMDAWRDIRRQNLSALRAITVALAVYYALAFSGAEIGNDINRALTPHVPPWMLDYPVYQILMGIPLTLGTFWMIGALIMGLNRSHGTVALVALLLFLALVEFPRWTLLPLLSTPERYGPQIAMIDTAMLVMKVVGLVTGVLWRSASRSQILQHE